MKKLPNIVICAFLLGTIATAKAAVSDHPEVAGNIKLLDAWIQSQLAYRGLPDISVGVVYQRNSLWKLGLGVLTLEGKVVATFGRWGNYDGQFMMAHDIALSPGGDIYVGDINGQRIQKLRWTNAR